ncbi:MAG: ARMT1-like domain-containing protein [Sulfurovum sp.]|nr:ARMT1-like domain-containing protein [Sulfurovum sp.]
MNIKPDCIVCLMNQALKVSSLLELDDRQSKEVLDATAKIVLGHDMDVTPPQIAKVIYRTISEITGVDDPVAISKRQAVKLALSVDKERVRTIDDAVKLSVIGNVIDFGAQKQYDLNEMISAYFDHPLAIDDTKVFREELESAKEIVVIGDNVGEHIFDQWLIEKIKERYDVHVYYFVRGIPIINDVTLKDTETLRRYATVMDTGVPTPGYDLSLASKESLEIFEKADIVISKGMGNFESLYGETKRNVYYLFTVKCSVVAAAIGQPVRSMIFHRV